MNLKNVWIQINGSFLSEDAIEEIRMDSNLGFVKLNINNESYELDTSYISVDGTDISVGLVIPEDSNLDQTTFDNIEVNEFSGSIWVEEDLGYDLTYQLGIITNGNTEYYDLEIE